MYLRRWSRCLLLGPILAILVASGCGSAKKATVTPASPVPLEATSWTLSGSTALGVALGDVAVSAQFENGSVTGSSGCNNYRASYTLSGSQLTIGPIAGTQMACSPAQMAVERAYLDRLAKVAAFTISGSQLTLTDASGHTLLLFQASNGASELIGVWTVTGYYSGTAITSVLGGVNLTADFGATTVSGSAGCNNFHGPYEATASSIKIGPLASTLVACPTPELATQEQHYLAALQLATTYKLTGARLDLYRQDGGIAVSFQRS